MENILRKLDILSGRIEFTYKGNKGYKNWVGGLLTLSIYSLVVLFSLILINNLFEKKDPIAYTVKKYLETGGTQMDSKNLYHNLAIINSQMVAIDWEDYKDIIHINSYESFSTFEKNIQYDYDICLLEDFKGIEYFYSLYAQNQKNVYCLRRMRELRNKDSSNEWKYNFLNFADQSIKETNSTNNISLISESNNPYQPNPDFLYPQLTIEKLENMREKKFFKIEITKCVNSTDLPYFCKSESEINEKIGELYLILNFIDNLFDVGNYSTPIAKYVNTKTMAIKQNTLSNLYLNFFLVNMITSDDLFFDSTSKIESYGFDFHSEAFTETNQELVVKVEFWVSNNSEIYERSYKKFQNIAAEIGGLYRFFMIAGGIINYLFEKYSNFIINSDLIDLLNVELDDEIINSKKGTFKNESSETNLKNVKKNFTQYNQIKTINYETRFKFNDFKKNSEIFPDNSRKDINLKSQVINRTKFKNLYLNNNHSMNDAISDNRNKTLNPKKLKMNIDKVNLENQQFSNNLNEEIIREVPKNRLFQEDANIFIKTKNINIFNSLKDIENIKVDNNNLNEVNKSNSYLIDNSKLIKSFSHKVNKVNSDSNQNKKKLFLKENNDKINLDKLNKFSSFQNKEIANSSSLNFESKIIKDNNFDTNKYNFTKSKISNKYLIETKSGFKKFFCLFIKFREPNRVIFTEKLRNMLLDEINYYKLHLDVKKIKKIVNERVSFKNPIDEIKLNIDCLIDSYFIYE